MNAHLKLDQDGPYAPIGQNDLEGIGIGQFTVLQSYEGKLKAKLEPPMAERSIGMGDRIMFPAWVRTGFVTGIAAFLLSFFASLALFMFDSSALYWLTVISLAVGATAIAVSLTGAKKHVRRAGASRANQDTAAVSGKIRSA